MDALRVVKFSELPNWSVQYTDVTDIGFTKKYPMVKIGMFLETGRDVAEIQDDVEYKQITLKINNGGVVPRNNGATILGSTIGTKRQKYIHSGQFIMSKIDARNGAYGIVPENLDGAIVTNDFPIFNVDEKQIIPQYLVLVSTTKNFITFAQKCSSGTTNRKRIDIDSFLLQKIPLPSKPQQEEIIARYNQTISEATRKDASTAQLEDEIEKYLFKALGIYLDNRRTFTNKTLQIIRYSNLDRWDAYGTDNSFSAALKKSNYPITPIGKVFDFITRTWDKIEPTFKYVEIGSVDPLLGIVHTEEIETKKAPSRATQIIREGDLILGTTRPYLKKFAIVDSQHDGHICSSGFQVIAPNKDTNVEFLYEYLKSSIAIAQFEFYMTGALYPAITIKDLKKILIPLPSIDIQNSIVEHINEMKSQIKLLKQQAADLRAQALKDFEKEIFE